MNLNGNWNLRWNDQLRGGALSRLLVDKPDVTRALTAQVPGSVHLDLLRAGLVAEPAESLNAYQARWVEETVWHYQRFFEGPALQPGEHATLVFECLDLVAKITLNGQEVGSHANAFYPCRLDVTQALRPGQNNLVVTVESGLFSVADRRWNGYGVGYDGALTKRQWLRQTQSTFGWDWSPRLINVGIRGDVRLEIHSAWRLESFVFLAQVSDDLQTGQVTARAHVEGFEQAALCGEISLEIAETGQRLAQSVQIKPGMNQFELTLNMDRPELWWPVNHGAQPLYHIIGNIQAEGSEARVEKKIGFRRVEIDQSPHPQGGRFFIIKVNHKPIFCKGGNFVPADLILARLDRAKYELLVDRALESNFNLLRVWGGGLYESEDFYDLCDEKGLLVWQEFIFACAKYPIHDEHFLADVRREVEYQVRRLAHRASLIVWCGNNEMEWGNWTWYDKDVALPDYALFHLVIPHILKVEDGTRFYQPSSPYSPDLEPPNQDDRGDQHPWSLGFFNTDFRGYRAMACRFPNEGGFLGPTALPTLLACLPGAAADTKIFDGAQGNALTFHFEAHDNSIASQNDQVYADEMLTQWLGKSITEMTVSEYAFYGGLVQGAALNEYIRNFRRRMFDTASAIYWMYNDCWPATRSWTTVDYYGRRTPSFHPVRRTLLPLTVVIALEADTVGPAEMVKVYGVNEGQAWSGELRWGLAALAGGYPLDRLQQVNIPANASTLLAEFGLDEWRRHGLDTHAAFAILKDDQGEIARDIFFHLFYKEMVWPSAKVVIRQSAGKAIFESQTFAWRVCLDLDGEKALPDNFFDLLPGIPTILDWPEELGEPKILYTGNLCKK
jgi:beta-mannosidase